MILKFRVIEYRIVFIVALFLLLLPPAGTSLIPLTSRKKGFLRHSHNDIAGSGTSTSTLFFWNCELIFDMIPWKSLLFCHMKIKKYRFWTFKLTANKLPWLFLAGPLLQVLLCKQLFQKIQNFCLFCVL